MARVEFSITPLPIVGGTMRGDIDMSTNVIILTAPDGTRYAVSVDNDGALGVTPLS